MVEQHKFMCCKVCARTLGEACGGPGGFSGTCEPPLSCVSKPPVGGSGVCMERAIAVAPEMETSSCHTGTGPRELHGTKARRRNRL
uniref:Uncharacterized protein n=1 Tax=Anopheles dirus TaxID=7168 RepID=A0A182N3U0_9DIPT